MFLRRVFTTPLSPHIQHTFFSHTTTTITHTTTTAAKLLSSQQLFSAHNRYTHADTTTNTNTHNHAHSGSCCGGDNEISEGEKKIRDKLVKDLDATQVNVFDMSGGCGTMYRVEVLSKKFNGKSVLEQHRMVNQVLQDDIATMHGLTIKTVVEK